MDEGGISLYQFQSNSECQCSIHSSQCMGDNVHTREENNPDHQLRSQNLCDVGKDVELSKQLGGWLRSSHPLKSA